MAKLTTQKFIERAIKIHGNKYDYSKTNYEGNKNKITITCSIHGDFQQRAGNHIYKSYGCPKCGKIKNVKSKNLSTYQKLVLMVCTNVLKVL